MSLGGPVNAPAEVQLLTVADVARLLRHDAPESPAAAELVRRLVRQGMPAFSTVRPMLFFADQVIEWLRQRAAPAQVAGTVARRRSARRSATTPATPAAPIAQRVAELRKGR